MRIRHAAWLVVVAVSVVLLRSAHAGAAVAGEGGMTVLRGSWTCRVVSAHAHHLVILNTVPSVGGAWLVTHESVDGTPAADTYYSSKPIQGRWREYDLGRDGSLTSSSSAGWAGARIVWVSTANLKGTSDTYSVRSSGAGLLYEFGVRLSNGKTMVTAHARCRR